MKCFGESLKFYNYVTDASYVLPLRKPGFKMIVVNTNIYYRNDEVTKGDEDPGGQFMWLEGKLQQARDTGEKVGPVACN